MNLCFVELKMKDYFKTECFASKWLILEGWSQGDQPEFWGGHWNKAKEKSVCFQMVMCHLPVTILLVGLMPVELLPIESVTEQDMFFEQGNRLVRK